MQDGTFSIHGHSEVGESQGVNGKDDEVGSPDASFHLNNDCAAVSDLLSRIGDKWSVLVVSMLGNRTMRFSELKREVGSISQKMLTTTLRNLERDGFVERTVHPTVPPKVEYALTGMGRDLLCPVSALGRWAVRNHDQVRKARRQFDATRDT